MKPCRHCGTSNAVESKFCQQCGKALADDSAADATMLWTGRLTHGSALRRAVTLDVLFARKDRLVIGRGDDCDVQLQHPIISRQHALLSRLSSGLELRDLGSVNGVLVDGRRIREPVLIQENARVGIGPYLFRLQHGIVEVLDNSQSLRLEARGLEKTVRPARGHRRKLLDNINLAVEPGEFVSLLGPSGSGKSTLMDCLNGRRPATGGVVLANGEDFYLHFDSFRQSLGYVPQRDIVHTQLSVYRALYYTARLRLPTDTAKTELDTRIEEVLAQMELEPHRHTLIGNLSGGQIKRVSLGAELLAWPSLLYIDEATSGLDAGTEARMMRLFRQLADEGKSVICITHNVDNVDQCNLIIVLMRGKLVYYGPPSEARPYFGITHISEIYDRLAQREAESWESEFGASALCREYVEKRLYVEPEPATGGQHDGSTVSVPLAVAQASRLSIGAAPMPPRPQRPPRWHQFCVLTARYFELIWRDWHNLRLVLLQAPIVALFILLGFINKPYEEKVLAPRSMSDSERAALQIFLEVTKPAYELSKDKIARIDDKQAVPKMVEVLVEVSKSEGPVVPDQLIVNPRFTYVLVFLLVVIVLWFGCNNAAKEIVKEEAIYNRERGVNLGILPYLASKFLVLSLMTALQALLLMALVYGTLEILGRQLGHHVPYSGYRLDYLPQFGVFVVLSMTSVALGLLLSACVSTPDRASTLLPYVLIPQIILGGGILTIKDGPLYYLAVLFSPAYWANRAIQRGATSLPADLPIHMDYNDSVWLACAALTLQMAALLIATAWFLRQKDVIK